MKSWTRRRAKRKAIDQNEIRRRSRRFGPFMAGARAARWTYADGQTRPCPYRSQTQAAQDWQNGYDAEWERLHEQR